MPAHRTCAPRRRSRLGWSTWASGRHGLCSRGCARMIPSVSSATSLIKVFYYLQ